MGQYIKLTICLSDIPREQIFTADNGRKYLTFEVNERRNGADQYGNTHFAKLRVRGQDGWEDIFIGKGKLTTFGNNGGQAPAQQKTAAAPAYGPGAPAPQPAPAAPAPDNDLPF